MPSDRKLRAILVLLRAAYTFGLLLIILDAAILFTREEKGRLLIIKSDSPMMRLGDAGGARARDDAADDLASSLAADRKLAGRFSVRRSTESQDESVTAAVVSLTDTSSAAVNEAESLTRHFTAPVFVVPVSAERGVPDVSVNAVDVSGTASLGLPLTLRAMLYARGMKGRATILKLSDEALTVTSIVVHWEEDSETKTVPLLLSPKVEGIHRYTVKADAAEGELNTQNNEIGFSVEARRVARKVLFMEDQPTWEGKFIRRALQENTSIVIDYFAQVSRSAVVGQQETEGARSPQSVVSDFARLAAYDAVILGPVSNSSISERAAKNLTAFVERRGGGLVILGGNDFSGSILSRSSPLNPLIPARVENPETGSGSHFQGAGDKSYLVPTEEGRELFRTAEGDEYIERLGPLADSYLRLMSLRPAAVALAVDGPRKQSAARVMIAAEEYGYGRTLLFAPSDSWKIALAETEKNKGAFALMWQNLVLWAAQSAEPPSSIRLRSRAVEVGDTVRAYLTARDDSFNPISQLSMRGVIRIDEPGAAAASIPMTVEHDPAAPGVYELSAPAPVEGDATLSLTFRRVGGDEQTLDMPFFVQKSRAAWRESPETNDRLREIARASSGELYEPHEIDLLKSKLLELNSESRTVGEAHRLRSSIALAFLLPLLMSVEYFIRKRYSTARRLETEGRSATLLRRV